MGKQHKVNISPENSLKLKNFKASILTLYQLDLTLKDIADTIFDNVVLVNLVDMLETKGVLKND
jgi:hypothetical protein